MPRFVVLEHDHPFAHWDLMLEAGEILRTWRLLARPVVGDLIGAEPAFDHRLFYLDYEGPVSGDRGRVVRWDVGTYVNDCESADEIVLRMSGVHLQGIARLRRVSDTHWQFQIFA